MMVTILQRLTLFALLLLALAAPAGAGEVARIDRTSLDVRDRGGTLCLDLRRESSSGSGSAGTCGSAPWRPLRSMLATVGTRDGAAAGGAVPAEITRGEVELADGRRVTFDTVAGERYTGRHAGLLRFFLVVLPVVTPRDRDADGVLAVRFFDAAGTLRGIAGARPLGPVISPRVTLLRQRVPGHTVTVSAQTRRTLAPTPLALERFEERTCLMVRAGGGESSSGRDSGGQPVLDLQTEPGCGRVRSTLYGFTADDVAAVRLTLGSGRTKLVRTRTVRGALGREYRVLATVVPRGEAVRSARAVGRAGRLDLGLPPGGLACVRGSGGGWVAYAPLPVTGPALPGADAQVVAERGGHRLLAGDGPEDRLCLGLDRLKAEQGDCRLPPVTADDLYYADGADGLAWAVLPAEVARVRLPGGREVSPIAGGYTGRYTGTVRFLLARVADGKRVTLLDAGGGVIRRLPVLASEVVGPDDRPRRAAGGRGWRLTASGRGPVTCLGVALRGEKPGCETISFGQDGAVAAVGCSPRLAVLYGPLARRTRTVRVTLAGGHTLRPRIVRIPRSPNRRAFAIALPRGARVTALRFDRRRTPFPVLPASRQCGYRLVEPVLGGDGEARAISSRAWRGTARPRGSSSSP
jgi:hypothetical protein